MGQKVINIADLPMELDQMYRNIIKAASKTRVKTTRDAGTYMVKKAKEFAPFKSGDTVAGITGKKIGKDYQVSSTVPGGYAQNVWADNRTMGGKNQVPYSWVQKTGISGGGFFTKAQEVTRKHFANIIVKDVSMWEIVK